jgi:hypothetical protein
MLSQYLLLAFVIILSFFPTPRGFIKSVLRVLEMHTRIIAMPKENREHNILTST